MKAFHSKSVFPEEPVELGAVAGAEPAPEDEVLRRRDGCDRVDLKTAEPAGVDRTSVAEPSSS